MSTKTFMEKMWKAKAKRDDSGLPADKSELRLHVRFSTPYSQFWKVEAAGQHFEEIVNISYGGIAIRIKPDSVDLWKIRDPSIPIPAKLTILGKSIDFEMSHVYTKDPVSGFAFIHSDSRILLFLRPTLEKLRCGTTMTPIERDLLKAKYQTEGAFCFRGDGPTDFVFNTDPNGNVTDFLLTFLDDKNYYHLRLKDGQLSSGSSLPGEGIGPVQMIESRTIDKSVLRAAICIFAGFSHQTFQGELKDRLIEECLKFL